MRGHLVRLVLVIVAGATLASCQSVAPAPGPNALATVGPDQVSHVYCRFVAQGSPAISTDVSTDVSPDAVRAFWEQRSLYEHRASIATPAEIAGAWATVAAFTRDELTPAIEAMGYVTIPAIREPDAVAQARVRIAIVDAGCHSIEDPVGDSPAP